MRFLEWFEASGLTEVAAAEVCGVSRSYIARLRRGARPSDEVKMKIEAGTKGIVRYEDWKPEVHPSQSDSASGLAPSQSDEMSGVVS